ncbi:hypothetical protein ABET51_06700 [Metabacillus fastidiosus]|uniref:hypothetical protein n=1 Tax=Metabacillus fastidiosus TaxID=1458 RepID=UPI003D2CE06E
MRIGKGYYGSPELLTSTANMEIITNGKRYYKFSFLNEIDCVVKINDGEPILLRERQGFSSEIEDQPISSFVIVNSGVQFNYIGAY